MSLNPKWRARAALCALVLLAACGGGGGGSETPVSADLTPPVLAISSDAGSAPVAAAVTLHFTWSEDVGASFTADDVQVSAGALSAWTQIDARRYSAVLTPPAGLSGAMGVSVPAARANDAAGNANAAPASLSLAFDTRVQGWSLVWSDEFDMNGLPNPANWDYDTARNAVGWFNNELQYYSRDRLDNARVQDGRLVITARREELRNAPDYGGQRFTSARLVTRGKWAWTYGLIEVRAKLPCSRGTWPAIWMLGTGGRWPEDGEIDIVEQTGQNKAQILGTIHTRAYNYFNGSLGVGRGASRSLSDACTAFHRYQLTWTADRIEIGVDDVVYMRYDNPKTGDLARWPFDQPQYLLLNVAMGGDLGGAIEPSFVSDSMEVDYVRVYRR